VGRVGERDEPRLPRHVVLYIYEKYRLEKLSGLFGHNSSFGETNRWLVNSSVENDMPVNSDIICRPSWLINDVALASLGEGQENPPFLVSLVTIRIKVQNLRILGIKHC
jgi:hypothetical protein